MERKKGQPGQHVTEPRKRGHDRLVQLFDDRGIEVLYGDILECPDVPVTRHAERYHAVFGEPGNLEIRDLGSNNIGMYRCWPKFYTLGPYWNHLDKLSDDDLEYYWDDTREGAKLKQAKDGDE